MKQEIVIYVLVSKKLKDNLIETGQQVQQGEISFVLLVLIDKMMLLLWNKYMNKYLLKMLQLDIFLI